MAINRVVKILTGAAESVRKFSKLYGGESIPGLWMLSRAAGGRKRGLCLAEFVWPNNPLTGYHANFNGLAPHEIRNLLRHAIRLGEVDEKRIQTSDHDWNCRGPVLGGGDRYSLRNKRGVPFSIIVCRQALDQSQSFVEVGHGVWRSTEQGLVAAETSRAPIFSDSEFATADKWDMLSEQEQERILRMHFKKLNENLRHLSGGRFNLQLQKIQFVDDDTVDSKQETNGFVMHIRYLYTGLKGYYVGKGHFILLPNFCLFHNRTGQLSTGLAIHEMMHGFLDGRHSEDLRKTGKTVYQHSTSSRIGLHPEEADILDWPHRQPVSSTLPYVLA